MFNVKKWYLLPFKKICSIEFFEKIELERYNLCLELYKLYTKINQRKRKISVVIFTYVTTFPDYQWISSQISNQLARGGIKVFSLYIQTASRSLGILRIILTLNTVQNELMVLPT